MPLLRRLSATLLIAALCGTALATPLEAATADGNGGVRVMPLGDSITDGWNVPGGYRIDLWRSLTAAGYAVDFVGTQFNGPCELADHDHQGHPGRRIDEISAGVEGWLAGADPHTVLLHIGTNDMLQNFDVAGAPARLSALIDKIISYSGGLELFVATITPLTDPVQQARVTAFNDAIPAIVRSKTDAGHRVHLVDMAKALSTADLADRIHPNRTGYDRMAAVWLDALRSVPGSIGGTGAHASLPTGSGSSPQAASGPAGHRPGHTRLAAAPPGNGARCYLL